MKSLLVTSTGGTVGPILLRMVRAALPESTKIVVADASEEVAAPEGFSQAVKLPFADSPEYADVLRSVIDKFDIDAVLPFAEEECLKIALMDLEGVLGARYLGMPYETLKIITDKVRCNNVLGAAGIDVPRSVPLTGLDDLVVQLGEFGYPGTPVVLKPVSARGSRGFRVISADTDRLEELQRKGGPVFMDLEQVLQTFGNCEAALKEYFLMEFLPGKSLSVDLVACKGKAIGIFPHLRLGYKWGFVDQALIERNPTIEAYCESVISTLGMHGLCNIEVGYREDGTPSLIEVNGRTSATAAQNMLLGANSLDLFLRAEAGEDQKFQFKEPVVYRTITEYQSVIQ